MNFFDFHVGDYMAATAHLSMLEDAAYQRLLLTYYRTESPIPTDVRQAARLVRAHSKAEMAAVAQVLREFFELRDDGWHNSRCDQEIEAFRASEPEREAKKANESNRLKLHREERSQLFQRLTDAGLHAPWNIGMGELRALVSSLKRAEPATAPATPATPPATPPETTPETEPATAPATPATATQYPLPTTQIEEIHPPPTSVGVPPAKNRRPLRKCPDSFELTPDLLAWAAETAPGVSVDDETAKFRDHTFKTAISDWPGAWRNWLRKAKEFAPAPRGRAPPESFRERDARLAAEQVARLTGGLAHNKSALKPRELLPFEHGYVAPVETIEGEAYEQRKIAR